MTRLFSDSVIDDAALEWALMIRDLDLALTRRSAPSLTDLGLSRAQIPVLAVIGEHPGSTGGELAEATGTTPQAVSQILARLTESGLVRRESLGGRAMGHHLTERGAVLAWLARERFRDVNRRFLSVLSGDETRVMLDSMRRVLLAMVADDDR